MGHGSLLEEEMMVTEDEKFLRQWAVEEALKYCDSVQDHHNVLDVAKQFYDFVHELKVK